MARMNYKQAVEFAQTHFDAGKCGKGWEGSKGQCRRTKKKAKSDMPDMSLEDLDRSEQMLKKSLENVGKASGWSKDKINTEWNRIKLNSQFADIHIEDL